MNGATNMGKLHTQILEQDGKPAFVVLPYGEFMALEEEIADLRDSRAIRDASQRDTGKPRLTLTAMRARLAAKRKSA
jgi:hypothetical protein